MSAPGVNLREALRSGGVFLDGTCGDRGDCGRCVVTVLSGDTGQPDKIEMGILGREPSGQGRRLACRITLSSDLKIAIQPDRLLELDRTGRWKEAWNSPLWETGKFVPGKKGWGLAVDLGTTSVASALFDLETGKPLDIISTGSPLIPWGEDIITRLQAYTSSTMTALKMRKTLWRSLSISAGRLSSRNGLSPGKIKQAVFVGNPASHHVALGLDAVPLLEPPFGPAETETVLTSPRDIGLETTDQLPHALIFPPPLGGFVGSDILVSLPAVLEHAGSQGALIDIGTNCEIIAWKGNRVVAASVAAGPAFEGGEIRNGMKAEEGAIFNVSVDEERIQSQVIGGGRPSGICGTGIVDTVSEMVRLGLVDASGLIQADSHPLLTSGGLLLDAPGDVVFSPADVEAVQKAKSAVFAALTVLAGKVGVTPNDLTGIYISGAFGSRLDVNSAMGIGLLPRVPPERFVLSGNTALIGASYCLLSEDYFEAVKSLASHIEIVSVADEAEFGDLFLENLFFG